MTDNNLNDRVVWLTGATGGLGHGIAHKLCEAGVKLVIHSYSGHDRLKKLSDELQEKSYDFITTSGDLDDAPSAKRAVEKINGIFGAVYGLVHAAGPIVRKPVMDHSTAEFNDMFHGNVNTFFEASKAVIGNMRDAGIGRIIGFGMVGAQHTYPSRLFGPHLAAKSALVALARTMAIEEASRGITVNIISPGHIAYKELSREEARKLKVGPQFPSGFPGSYEDIADSIKFLLSPDSLKITGAVLDVNGGWMGDDWIPSSKPAEFQAYPPDED